MKNVKIKVIAAAAVISTVVMFAGCGTVIGSSTQTTAAQQGTSLPAVPANEIKPAEIPQAQVTANEITTQAVQSEAPKAEAPKAETVQQAPASTAAAKSEPVEVVIKVDDNRTQSAPAAAETAKAAPAQTAAPKTETPKTETSKTEAPKAAQNTQSAQAAAPVKVSTGRFFEQADGAATMDISDSGNGIYSIHIAWPVNSNEVNAWDLSGQFDSKGVLNYTNCVRTTYAYDANGNYCVGTDGIQTPFSTYTAGSGSLEIKSYGIVWNDNMGDIFKGTTFASTQPVKTAKPAEKKADTNTVNSADTAAAANAGTAAADLPAAGSYYDGNGARVRMQISKQPDGTYFCKVTASDSYDTNFEYDFTCTVNGSVLEYTGGTFSKNIYNEYGLVSSTLVSTSHAGSIRCTNTGTVWSDCDGSLYVFLPDPIQ